MTRRYATNARPHEISAPLERTPTLRLIWHGRWGGLLLVGLGLVATLAVVAVQ